MGVFNRLNGWEEYARNRADDDHGPTIIIEMLAGILKISINEHDQTIFLRGYRGLK